MSAFKKNKWIKFFFALALLLAIFLLPISPTLEIESDGRLVGELGENKAKAQDIIQVQEDYNYNCHPLKGEWTGCFAAIFYNVLFRPVAALTELVAKIFDYLIYYSTNSDSYKGGFIGKAWGAVRDIANIFFIIALLYIAIKTILNIGASNNKKLIGFIIIFALLINFSLFFTQVIIDSSNILAKVFYNQLSPVDQQGKELKPNEDGSKSITVALVATFNPHEIISKEVYNGHEVQFIFITLLSVAVMVYMIYIFATCALLFVGRVVMLWLSMVFSPIAFASYALPFDIPGLGHKQWWENLLKNAFLAPIFIFFLYVIFLFGDALKSITVSLNANDEFLIRIMESIIPFAIIFVLLMKAKKMAVEYSGEMGKMVSKIGSMVGGLALGAGGLALGAAVGGAAVLGRRTIGRNALKNFEGDKGKALKIQSKQKGFTGWQARQRLKMMEGASKASFDVRTTSVGKKFSKVTGMNLENAKALGLGSKEGGFEKTREDVATKRQKWSEKLKVGKNETLNKELREHQENLQQLKNMTNADITKIDKDLREATARQAEISRMSNSPEKTRLQDLYTEKINVLRNQKKAIKEGKAFIATYTDEDGSPKSVNQQAHSITDKNGKKVTLKTAGESVIEKENEIAQENSSRLQNEANRLRGKKRSGNKSIYEEAAHRIMMGAQAEENKKH
jgi:hypothetical protein